jgi:hypothetical protein
VIVGDFAVGCDGSLSQAEVEALSGLKSLELPARLTFSTAQRLHRIGMIPSPSTELRYVVYPWVVVCTALHAAGWQPSFSNAEALSVLLAGRAGHHAVVGRRIARKDAAITAAGAAGTAAAVIGTAAIVRHARKKGKT